MITQKVPFNRIFAAGKLYNITMAKTKYQEAATDYARKYLDELLKMENILGQGLDSRIEEAVAKYMKENQEKVWWIR